MKTLSIFLIFSLLSNICFADCDFGKMIHPNPDGSYTYQRDCHVKVGQIIEDDKAKDQQIKELNQGIAIKNEVIKKQDDRVNLWMGTSEKLETRINAIDSEEKKNYWIFFGLGVLTTFAAGYVAAQAIRQH